MISTKNNRVRLANELSENVQRLHDLPQHVEQRDTPVARVTSSASASATLLTMDGPARPAPGDLVTPCMRRADEEGHVDARS